MYISIKHQMLSTIYIDIINLPFIGHRNQDLDIFLYDRSKYYYLHNFSRYFSNPESSMEITCPKVKKM